MPIGQLMLEMVDQPFITAQHLEVNASFVQPSTPQNL